MRSLHRGITHETAEGKREWRIINGIIQPRGKKEQRNPREVHERQGSTISRKKHPNDCHHKPKEPNHKEVTRVGWKLSQSRNKDKQEMCVWASSTKD